MRFRARQGRGHARPFPSIRLRPAAVALATAAAAVLAGTGSAQAEPVAQPFATSSCVLSSSFTGPAFGLSAGAGARAGGREPGGWKNPPIEEAPGSGTGSFSATVPVYFHVFTDGAEGRLSQSTLQKQISVLNKTYSGTGFSFVLVGSDTTDNATWFRKLDLGTSVERDAKAATRQGDAATLNIWTTDGPSYLGFATFPSDYKTAPQLDGIVIDYKSFPGGSYGSDYSLGKTATHETGHWLGLLHTFQGACNDKGDYVDDTPFEATPTSGCPKGKDTCPEPGSDPIHNYMDYSYDSCYTEFTAGQTARMHAQYAYFRAGGGTSVGSP